jgi:hypothetical protein
MDTIIFEDKDIELVWITLINYGYIDFTKNFLKSAKNADINIKLYVFCINFEKCVNELKDFDNCVCINADIFIKKKVSDKFSVWSKLDYKTIVFCKLDAIKYALETTFNKGIKAIGFIDTDIILLSDPSKVILNYMEKYPEAIILGQCDEQFVCTNRTHCINMCSGAIVFKNNPSIYQIFKYNQNDIYNFMGDQDFLVSKREQFNIKSITIDRNIFINGTYPGVKDGKKLLLKPEASLIHFNWLVGEDKIKYMKLHNMWYL